jgi:hypothetical protein
VQFLGETAATAGTSSPEVQFIYERMGNPQQKSPDVQFLGERIFNNICNSMSDKIDNLYNAGLTLAGPSASLGKENRPPKRIINRSNYLCSPFHVSILSPRKFQSHELKIYETITTLCDHPKYQE